MLKKTTFLNILVAFFVLNIGFIYAQKTNDIVVAFENYIEAPRELIYTHLNKSTYVQGEMMGFTAYAFDKLTKTPSLETKNLYCTISDSEGTVIKQKLLKVQNGIASNVFDIDSSLSSGVFTFKAYTNWMRNFEENNHFQQTFKVIDADNLDEIIPFKPSDFKIDLQLLGEGGHLVYGLQNTVGIIAKNQFEQGLKNIKGEILNGKNQVLSKFVLNNVGIAKTVLIPKIGETYHVKINVNGQDIQKEIKDIQNSGMSLTLSEFNSDINIKLQSNALFSGQFKNDAFKIGLHSGSEMKISEFKLDNDGQVILRYPKSELFTGINIFTIFTDDNKPFLERLYFNYTGIESLDINKVVTTKLGDSLTATVNLKTTTTTKWSHLSVSVLPEDTKSYNHNNSLVSHLFIQPYVNGTVENGSQYFSDDIKANYNLDLLLLTQGWSSYDWNAIFNYNTVFIYPFERGIDIVSTINGPNPGTYVVYPINEASTQIYELKSSEKEFTIKNRFPTKDDLFRVGYIDTKNRNFTKKPSLYMQYFPSYFPSFNQTYSIPIETFESKITSLNEVKLNKSWKKAEQLDTVVVNASKEYTKLEKLANTAINSRFDIISEETKARGMRIDTYLQRLGYDSYFDVFSGNLIILNLRMGGSGIPLVYLNKTLLNASGTASGLSQLTFVNMTDVDYIEYEPYGVGAGPRAKAGYIKIFTKPNYTSQKTDNVQPYEVPLKFSKTKKFYTPKYKLYNSNFFNEYGTIDWLPNVTLKDDGSFDIKILDTKNNFKLFIEGIVDDKYISKALLVEL
jgi:hypothetical protein